MGGSDAEFSRVQAAWDQVKTPELRRGYDADLAAGRFDAPMGGARAGASGMPYGSMFDPFTESGLYGDYRSGRAAPHREEARSAVYIPGLGWVFATGPGVPHEPSWEERAAGDGRSREAGGALGLGRMTTLAFLLAFFFPPGGIVASIAALRQAGRAGGRGRGSAAVALALSVLLTVAQWAPTLIALFS